MTQNLRYYWRQRIVALVDKQCKFSCIDWVRFEHAVVPSANKISYDSLLNLKKYWDERIHVKEPLCIFFCNMKEMSEFCKSVKPRRFIS